MKYESASETAKKVRKALKANFPGTKFSVCSKNYAGGCSVSVSYTDGPAIEKVNAIIGQYESTSFDGMIDLATTHGYTDPETGEHCNGADYVTAHRDLSLEATKALADKILNDYGIDEPEAVTMKEMPPTYSRRMRKMTKGHRWVDIKHISISAGLDLSTMIHRESVTRDF